MFRPLAKLRALPDRLRFKLYPHVAKARLELATRRARGDLAAGTPIRILVDNTVLDIAVTHETRWITTGISNWGHQPMPMGYAARVPVYGRKNKSERYKQATYLTGIAHLAHLGLIALCKSAELSDEQFRQPMGRYRGYGYFDYSLFSHLKIESVDGWVFPTMGPKWMNLPPAAQQQRARLRQSDDPLFHDLYALLRQQLGPKCTQDAWHIRTAERHGLFCFLTTDGPLLKACESLAKKEPLRSMKTRVMSPVELGRHLRIAPVPPHLLSYNAASWFVRMDHTMPDERRRKVGEYSRVDGHPGPTGRR
jgi:hypothetical protein